MIFYSHANNLKDSFSNFDKKLFSKIYLILIEANTFKRSNILYMIQSYNTKEVINEKIIHLNIICEIVEQNFCYFCLIFF